MRVMVRLRPSSATLDALDATQPAAAVAETHRRLTDAVEIDAGFDPVVIPAPDPIEPGADPYDATQPLAFSFARERATPLVRGDIPDAQLTARVQELTANPDVEGVFSDPLVESSLICPDGEPIGTHRDVARALGTKGLEKRGMTGSGVRVAVVDSGINIPHLRSVGRKPRFDARRSFVAKGVKDKPGRAVIHEGSHGTMCAFAVGIAAPDATLLDYVLTSVRRGRRSKLLLSEAVRAYGRLLRMIRAVPPGRRRLVVTNSWNLYNPRWDFPPGHPGNYSGNPAHPFNVIVSSLEAEGADILFSAGNCGPRCTDARCAFEKGRRTIGGANSHPRVLCVASLDHRRRLIGSSSHGPGRLAARKPDIASYSEYWGSQLAASDDGTSAACAVAAGAVAAVRSKYSAKRVTPAELRALIHKTAEDLGRKGYDLRHGFGAIDPVALADRLAKVAK